MARMHAHALSMHHDGGTHIKHHSNWDDSRGSKLVHSALPSLPKDTTAFLCTSCLENRFPVLLLNPVGNGFELRVDSSFHHVSRPLSISVHTASLTWLEWITDGSLRASYPHSLKYAQLSSSSAFKPCGRGISCSPGPRVTYCAGRPVASEKILTISSSVSHSR